MLQVLINYRGMPMMAHTGATYTCVGPSYASHLPLAGKFTKTLGFSEHTQLIPMTAPSHRYSSILILSCICERMSEE